MMLGVETQMNLGIIFTFCLKILVWLCLQLYLGWQCGGGGCSWSCCGGSVCWRSVCIGVVAFMLGGSWRVGGRVDRRRGSGPAIWGKFRWKLGSWNWFFLYANLLLWEVLPNPHHMSTPAPPLPPCTKDQIVTFLRERLGSTKILHICISQPASFLKSLNPCTVASLPLLSVEMSKSGKLSFLHTSITARAICYFVRYCQTHTSTPAPPLPPYTKDQIVVILQERLGSNCRWSNGGANLCLQSCCCSWRSQEGTGCLQESSRTGQSGVFKGCPCQPHSQWSLTFQVLETTCVLGWPCNI